MVVKRTLQICLTLIFFFFRVWFESFVVVLFMLITVHLKKKKSETKRKTLPPLRCGKDPCAGKLDLKESLILRRPIANGDGHFLPGTNDELCLKMKTFSRNWPF